MSDSREKYGSAFYRLLFMLPAIALAVMIFCFSAQPSDDSTEVSQFVTAQLIRFSNAMTGTSLSESQAVALILRYEPIVREMAHFTEYALLGFFLTFGLAHNGVSRRRCMIVGILVVFYAVSDEVHQMFVPGRTAQIVDILADSSGGITGMLIYTGFHHLFVRRKAQRFSSAD